VLEREPAHPANAVMKSRRRIASPRLRTSQLCLQFRRSNQESATCETGFIGQLRRRNAGPRMAALDQNYALPLRTPGSAASGGEKKRAIGVEFVRNSLAEAVADSFATC
jgi:hypothetical protein